MSILTKMIFGALLACLAMAPVATVSAKEKERKDLVTSYCKPVWSADGTRVKQTFAKTRSNCGYDTEHVAVIVDYVLEVLCSAYKCTHISQMTVKQRRRYDDLRAAQNNAREIDHVTCVHRTPDNEVLQVITMYAHLFDGESCNEGNIVRTYNTESGEACVRDAGCVPIQYVDGPDTEYSRIMQEKPTTGSVTGGSVKQAARKP